MRAYFISVRGGSEEKFGKRRSIRPRHDDCPSRTCVRGKTLARTYLYTNLYTYTHAYKLSTGRIGNGIRVVNIKFPGPFKRITRLRGELTMTKASCIALARYIIYAHKRAHALYTTKSRVFRTAFHFGLFGFVFFFGINLTNRFSTGRAETTRRTVCERAPGKSNGPFFMHVQAIHSAECFAERSRHR